MYKYGFSPIPWGPETLSMRSRLLLDLLRSDLELFIFIHGVLSLGLSGYLS